MTSDAEKAESIQTLFTAAPGEGVAAAVGDVVTGTVTAIEHEQLRLIVTVGNVAYSLPFTECVDAAIAVGDAIAGTRIEGVDGELLLSSRQAARERAWERVAQAHQTQAELTGSVVHSVLGGWSVDLGGGIEGFLPDALVGNQTLVPGVPISVFVGAWDRKRGQVLVGDRPLHKATPG